MRHLRRRAISFTVVLVALPVLVLLLPVIVVAAAVVDLASGLRRFPTVRLGVFALVYVIHEWVGLVLAAWLRVAELIRLFDATGSRQLVRYRNIQAWWATSLLTWARRLLGVRFDLDDLGTLPADGFVLLSRHASMVDALLPAVVVAGRLRRFVHYVIKQELRWDPNLDLYGHRLGNYFVARDGDGDAEARAIERFAEASQPESALVIFPEGTYSTPARKRQVRESLARRGHDTLVALADDLKHLLPPKPAGTLALLTSRPTADVVFFGHVGLEGVTDSGLRRLLPLRHPVVVRWWVHARATVPTSAEEQIAWLNDQWRTLDQWVESVVQSRAT